MKDVSRWADSRLWTGRRLTWDLWYRCNYRCSYCWFEMDKVWDKLAKEHEGIGVARWIEAWERLYERCGTISVDVLGGEPLLYPSGLDLFAGMARWHRLYIISNLSASMDFLERLASRIPPERLHLSASYHHQFARWEEFWDKVLFLAGKGYHPEVTMVSWPPLLDDIDQKRKILEAAGIRCDIHVFQGIWEGRDYPRSYSSRERGILGGLVPQDDDRQYRMHEAKTIGRLCAAGHVYANVKANGDVFRCGKDSMFSKPMGNMFDPEFRLLDAPAPCPYNFCNACGEHVYLWDDWKRVAADLRSREIATSLVESSLEEGAAS